MTRAHTTTSPTTVHLVFKTHLDVGFTELAHEVVARYFQQYIPQALDLAERLRREESPERFTWTTGSWLIYEYLEQASTAERRRMEEAIGAGDIAWHALPFTTHSELVDPDLFRFGLSLAAELDRRFGKQTIAAKMTDVPGHTRGIVRLLAEAGVQFLHIGVNAASTPPAVPPVFVWRDPDGSEITVMYQRGGYGQLVVVPGLDQALAFAHTNDNLGPQSTAEVHQAFAAIRRRFPQAVVRASTMDAFARTLLPLRSLLPVVTQELGDTWIHGAASDPMKMAHFRALLRLRRQWLAQGRAKTDDPAFRAFSRALLLVAEHTWGLDVKTHLADYQNWSAPQFGTARSRPEFQKMESSWAEQRAYVHGAITTLNDSPLAAEAAIAIKETEPSALDISGFTEIAAGNTVETTHFRLAFDANGAVARLDARSGGRRWAGSRQPLGLLRYQTFSQAAYDRFYRQYVINRRLVEWWAVPDLTKPGITEGGAIDGDWLPMLTRLYHRYDRGEHRFVADLAMPETCSHRFGCPRRFILQVILTDERPAVFFDLQWFDKPASRLPEALWFSFVPRVRQPRGWRLEKMGELISPLEVVHGGNRKLHAVGEGIFYEGVDGRLALESFDAPLVAPGKRSLLDFNNRQPPLARGMHFLLYDNVWGTNFPMWYDDDARFRFRLETGQSTKEPHHAGGVPS